MNATAVEAGSSNSPGERSIVLCFLAASLCVTLYQTRSFYFFSDDFLNFIIASDMGLTKAYLTRDVFGQFVPLYRLVNYVYLHCFGLAFWPFRLMLVLFHWLIILTVSRLCSARQAPPFALLLALAFTTFSPVFATTQQWWSAALSVLTSAGAISVALVLDARSPRLTHIEQAVIAFLFLVGLGAYPKALVTVILLFSVRLFARRGGAGETLAKSIVSALVDLWPVVLTVVFYAAVVSMGGYSAAVPRPTLHVAAEFIVRGWNYGFLSGSLGLVHAPALLLVGLNTVVLAIVAASVALHPRAVLLWGAFAAYFIVSTGLIAWNRAVPFGVESADTGRYYVDTLCFLVIFSVIALGGHRPAAPLRGGSNVQLVATCLLCVFLISASGAVPHLWYAGPKRPAAFVTNLRAGLAKAGRADLSNATTVVPDYVMPGWMWPLNQYRYFVPLLGAHVPESFGGLEMYVREDGTVQTDQRK